MNPFWRWEHGRYTSTERPIVREAAVALVVNGERLGTMMVTPERLDEFAVGFLFLEGVIDGVAGLTGIAVAEDEIRLEAQNARPVSERKYNTSALSSNRQFAEEGGALPAALRGESLTPERILELVRALNANAEQYRQSGGVHTSALACADGAFLVAADVGRHNTVDKLIGHCLLNQIPHAGGILITSGRITLELVHKARRAQVPLVISRTSPTDVAIRLADALGIMLIGYARGGAFNVYTHAEWIAEQTPAREPT